MRHYLILFLLSTIQIAVASDPLCFQKLFKVRNEGGITTDQIIKHYHELLNQVGEGKMSPDILLKIQESGDPFSIPKDVSLGSATLADSLSEFKSMLTQHFKGDLPVSQDLLDSLSADAKNKASEAKKQKKSDKKTEAKKLEVFIWDKPIREIQVVGDWLVAPGAAEHKNGWKDRNAIDYINLSGRKLTLPYTKKYAGKLVVPVVNPGTGELYFSDRQKGNLWAIDLFEDLRNPLKKLTVKKINIPNGTENGVSIDEIVFSKNGHYALFIDNHRGVFFSDLLGGASNGKVDFQHLGKKSICHGHFGDEKVYFSAYQDSPIVIYDSKTGTTIDIPQRSWLRSINGSLDGKYVYVMREPKGLKPLVEIWNLEEKAKKPSAKPFIWNLGHKDAVQEWETGGSDEIVPLPGSQLVAHLYVGRKSQEGIVELRIEDPLNKTILLTEPVNLENGEQVKDLFLTTDQRFIHGTSEHSNHRKKSWLWNLEALMSRVGG